MKLPKLILASASPRRAEILENVGWEFETIVADIDESILSNESPARYVQRLAAEKARAVAVSRPSAIVLGADTTVVVGDDIIGKPIDHEDAVRMLSVLAGREHLVMTGVALVCGDTVVTGVRETTVRFNPMSDAEIEFLADRGDPLDKAGAYAVQAQAALFIEEIIGDYWNVVGLPISLVYQLIADIEQDKQPE